MSDSLRPHESQPVRPPCPSPTPAVYSTHVHRVGDAIQPSHPLSSPSPPAPNPSQHQGRKELEAFCNNLQTRMLKRKFKDFPGDTVYKNLLPMQLTCVWSLVWGISPAVGNWAFVPQLLSLCFTAREPQLLSLYAATAEAHVPRAYALQQEKPLLIATRESLCAAMKT